jgi:serine/threonine protein kinase
VMVPVCGALEEAHTQGIVHRDLKPENIFLTTQGGIADYPKVLDFGLAKVTEREMRPGSLILTQEGMVFGTPEFMSPEQARGEKLDGRSDIYSLGIIMYELLTGKLPFDASQPMEFIQKHIKEQPIPLSRRAPNRVWPNGMWEVLDKALAKKPADRFQTANELAQALRNVQANAGHSSSSPPFPQSTSGVSSLQQQMQHPVSPQPLMQQPVQQQQPAPQVQPQPAPPVQQPAPSPANYAMRPEPAPVVPGMGTPAVAWVVLGLGALLALLGTIALVAAFLLR